MTGFDLGIHLFIHVEQMYAWAEGNIMLIWGTIWFTLTSVWNVGLLLKMPELLTLPRWTRLVPFGLSIMHLSYFFSGTITEVMKVLDGETWVDTVEEIVFAYLLWINTPTAVTELIYLYLEVAKTDDISIKKPKS